MDIAFGYNLSAQLVGGNGHFSVGAHPLNEREANPSLVVPTKPSGEWMPKHSQVKIMLAGELRPL